MSHITAPLDAEGFLLRLEDWTPDIARHIAQQEGITLTPAHWEIITSLQTFYKTFEVAPAMRPLSRYLASTLGKEKSGSIYLLKLFPGSPAKYGAKIAGLPKPENCL
ncbi:TusE/DsrC/DsvC family sulfur relay protein [Marinagarivorans algicola]|uniref:TusE/DsrC/DsvC family sulfur relay protein n=1 Tax=Marinagarivorans algicola TaxID=1513270 RepID=UPI0006B695C5|nr:TusE/DsrC/DsvC family sulfur relay protein [Marinagarivorans algicola]